MQKIYKKYLNKIKWKRQMAIKTKVNCTNSQKVWRIYSEILLFFLFWSLNTGELKNLVSENLSPRLILLQNEEMKWINK